jgi:hypothetical protein
MPAATFGDQRDQVRRIGPIGTWSRTVVGVGLVVIGVLGTLRPSGIAWYKLVIGLVALPLLLVVLAVIAEHYRPSPLRLTGPLGTGINCLVIVGLAANNITGPTVELFYGATLSWQPGEHYRAAKPRSSPTGSSTATTRLAAPCSHPSTTPNNTTDSQHSDQTHGQRLAARRPGVAVETQAVHRKLVSNNNLSSGAPIRAAVGAPGHRHGPGHRGSPATPDGRRTCPATPRCPARATDLADHHLAACVVIRFTVGATDRG